MLKSRLGYVLPLVAMSFINLHCQSTKGPQAPSSATSNSSSSGRGDSYSRTWPNQMQQLTYHLSLIMPKVSDSKAFNNPQNKNEIQSQLKKLQTIAHEMNTKTQAPDQDPSLQLIGQRFEDNLKLSLESFEAGHSEFARSVFKNSMAQCVQCHTRLEIGPALAVPNLLNGLDKIAIVERIQFLIASRYFDEANKEINQAIQSGETLSIVAWQKIVQMGLVINVRFYNDTNKAKAFIQTLNESKNLPYFLKRNIPFWNQAIKEWAQNATPSTNLKVAQKIITRAEKAQKDSRSDGGTIDYLRAGRLLHQLLSKTQIQNDKAEALYQLGLIYENIGEIGAWSMNEDYYELCIRAQPHSDMAKKCFARFQESTVAGFSGTAGLYIPEEVQKKMNELRAMAL